MDTNFNETFLDKNSASYNYYIGIPNMETNNVSDIENSIKMYKKLNLYQVYQGNTKLLLYSLILSPQIPLHILTAGIHNSYIKVM